MLGPSHYHVHMVHSNIVQFWYVHVLTSKNPFFPICYFSDSTQQTPFIHHPLLFSIVSQPPSFTSSSSQFNSDHHHLGKVHVSTHLSCKMIHTTCPYIISPIWSWQYTFNYQLSIIPLSDTKIIILLFILPKNTIICYLRKHLHTTVH